MTTIRNATDEELRAESERRAKTPERAPGKLPLIDWTRLESMLDDYVTWAESDAFNHDEDGDWKGYVFEMAIETIRGPAFWDWFRRTHP